MAKAAPKTGAAVADGAGPPPADADDLSPPSSRRSPRKVVEASEARRRERERQHWEGCGRQISSVRPTLPIPSIATPRVVESAQRRAYVRHDLTPATRLDYVRCHEIAEHPNVGNPSPDAYNVGGFTTGPSRILRDWGREPRFLEDLPLAVQNMPELKKSTLATPFSRTYPWNEPQTVDGAADTATSFKTANSLGSQAKIDFNGLYLRTTNPSWSFGSSGVGDRFQTGTNSSRQHKVHTTSRLLTFRDRRDELPQMTPAEFERNLRK